MFEWFGKWILYFILRLLSWSYRIQIVGKEHIEKAKHLHPEGAFLLSFWHEHLISPLFAFQGTRFCVLTSDSRDGKIIGFQCEKFGNNVVHGSQNREGKDKGGLRALIGMLHQLKQGIPVAITVDGSIGPRRYVKAGVIELARKSQAAILPLSSVASSYWTLNTWDQFKIPKPFSKIIVRVGEPIFISASLNKEEIPTLQEQIAAEINKLENASPRA